MQMNEFPEEHVKVSSRALFQDTYRKYACANERIPRRTRKSVFFGIRSFYTLPKVTGLPEVIEAENRTAMMNSKTNRTGNAACQQIVFESLWRSVFLLCRLIF